MKNKSTPPPTIMEKICEVYESNPLMPFLVIGMNMLGLGIPDRLISKRANDCAIKQLKILIEALQSQIDPLIREPRSEAFMPGFNIAVREALETLSVEKVQRLAAVLGEAWNKESVKWDEIAQTLRIIRQLEEPHFAILKVIDQRQSLSAEGASTVSVGHSPYQGNHSLLDSFPDVDPMLLTSCLSDLVAIGLVNDTFSADLEGEYQKSKSGQRTNVPFEVPMAFSISKLGQWLLLQVKVQSSK